MVETCKKIQMTYLSSMDEAQSLQLDISPNDQNILSGQTKTPDELTTDEFSSKTHQSFNMHYKSKPTGKCIN